MTTTGCSTARATAWPPSPRITQNGITLQTFTTEPGIQVYTGNFLVGDLIGTSGNVYRQGDAFTLETQHYPDAPHHIGQAGWPSVVLNPNATFNSTTAFKFSVAGGGHGGHVRRESRASADAQVTAPVAAGPLRAARLHVRGCLWASGEAPRNRGRRKRSRRRAVAGSTARPAASAGIPHWLKANGSATTRWPASPIAAIARPSAEAISAGMPIGAASSSAARAAQDSAVLGGRVAQLDPRRLVVSGPGQRRARAVGGPPQVRPVLGGGHLQQDMVIIDVLLVLGMNTWCA